MGPSHPRLELGRAIACWTFLALTGATEASGGDVLKDRGLQRSGALYVLGAEAEVHAKMDEARTKFEPLEMALAQMVAIAEAEVQRKALELQRTMLRRRIDDINVQLGRYPIPRWRNNFQRDDCNLLQNERDSATARLE